MSAALSHTWGTAAEERARPFPCDELLPDPDDAYYRAVDVAAAPAVVFRWLCQLRAAPYSYDWLDNFGRRSPQRLSAGLERLELGQTVMTIFELAAFERDVHLTVRTRRLTRLFGDVAVTYLIEPAGFDGQPAGRDGELTGFDGALAGFDGQPAGRDGEPTGFDRESTGCDRCRLLVKVLVRHPRAPLHGLRGRLLPWGDLLMMRRQLLNLKRLAERQATPPRPRPGISGARGAA
jgi:hypothetical protein